MSMAGWVILIESIALVPVTGWAIFREVTFARAMALAQLEVEALKAAIAALERKTP